jgi:hypothetical protein
VPVPAPVPRLPRSVTWGLLAAWAVHDAEELVTMPGWADRARPRLERTLPRAPARVRDALCVSRPHATVAIGLVGAFVTAASARGPRTGGADPRYQATLAGFGWHAVPHVASALVTRGYTPVCSRPPRSSCRSRSGRGRGSGAPGSRWHRPPAQRPCSGPWSWSGRTSRRPVCSGSPTGGGRDAVPEILRDPCRSGPRPFDVLVRGR